jgi:hypothetical protein
MISSSNKRQSAIIRTTAGGDLPAFLRTAGFFVGRNSLLLGKITLTVGKLSAEIQFVFILRSRIFIFNNFSYVSKFYLTKHLHRNPSYQQ